MANELSNLHPVAGERKNRTRVGRGEGSGKGKTAGRGTKGAQSRSGYTYRPGFEGGQMPLHRRLPKKGFTNIFATKWSIVNLSDLERVFEAGAVVTPEALAEKGLIWKSFRRPGEGKEKKMVLRPVKVLGGGELTRNLTVKANKFSKSAEQAIVAAGGSIEVL